MPPAQQVELKRPTFGGVDLGADLRARLLRKLKLRAASRHDAGVEGRKRWHALNRVLEHLRVELPFSLEFRVKIACCRIVFARIPMYHIHDVDARGGPLPAERCCDLIRSRSWSTR